MSKKLIASILITVFLTSNNTFGLFEGTRKKIATAKRKISETFKRSKPHYIPQPVYKPQIKVFPSTTKGIENLEVKLINMEEQNIQSLVTRFAPMIVLSPRDESSPTSPLWFIENCRLRARAIDESKNLIVDDNLLESNPTPKSIAIDCNKASELKEKYINNQNIKIECYLNYKEPNVIKGEQFRNNYYDAECFVNAVYLPQLNQILLQYMLFYAFNGGIPLLAGKLSKMTTKMEIGIHEGDWEQVDVWLTRSNNGFIISRVGLSQHGDMYPFSNNPNIQKNEKILFANNDGAIDQSKGTHPICYAAINTHANYLKPIRISNKIFDSTTNLGNSRNWLCWRNAKFIGYPPYEKNSWFNFHGRWGGTSEYGIMGKRAKTIPFTSPFGYKPRHGNSPAIQRQTNDFLEGKVDAGYGWASAAGTVWEVNRELRKVKQY